MATIDPKLCPICGGRMKVTRSTRRSTDCLRRKYRHCPTCGRSDTILVEPERVVTVRVFHSRTPRRPQADPDALS